MSTRTTVRVVVALAVCAGGLGAACAGGDQGWTGDRRSNDVVIIDETLGTFRGVRLGDSAAQVRRRIGPSTCTEEAPIAPLGEDYDEIGGPYSGANYQPRDKDGPYTQCGMRYRSLALTVFVPDGAIRLVTTDPRARTRRGVGIGDSAELVKERYPGAMCRGFVDTGDVDSSPGVCEVPPVEGSDGVVPLLLFFGLDDDGEEVRSIWLDANSWAGIKALRRR